MRLTERNRGMVITLKLSIPYKRISILRYQPQNLIIIRSSPGTLHFSY